MKNGNDDNAVKDTTLSTIWEAFSWGKNPFTGGFSIEAHNRKGISVGNIKFCFPQVIITPKRAATTSITDKEKFKPQTNFTQMRINNREARTNNQDGFMPSKTYKSINICTRHETIYNVDKSNAKIIRYDSHVDDAISSLGDVNDNLDSNDYIDAQII